MTKAIATIPVLGDAADKVACHLGMISKLGGSYIPQNESSHNFFIVLNKPSQMLK